MKQETKAKSADYQRTPYNSEEDTTIKLPLGIIVRLIWDEEIWGPMLPRKLIIERRQPLTK